MRVGRGALIVFVARATGTGDPAEIVAHVTDAFGRKATILQDHAGNLTAAAGNLTAAAQRITGKPISCGA